MPTPITPKQMYKFSDLFWHFGGVKIRRIFAPLKREIKSKNHSEFSHFQIWFGIFGGWKYGVFPPPQKSKSNLKTQISSPFSELFWNFWGVEIRRISTPAKIKIKSKITLEHLISRFVLEFLGGENTAYLSPSKIQKQKKNDFFFDLGLFTFESWQIFRCIFRQNKKNHVFF